MNSFRAVLLPNDCISISKVDAKGDVVRHVATIEKTAVPQFLDDMQLIAEEVEDNTTARLVAFVRRQ